MELLIIRHAAAEERDADRWPDDRERPLTAVGRRRFSAMLECVGHRLPPVDRLLSSRFERAWSTAELLHRQLDLLPALRCEALEDGDETELLEALREYARFDGVAMVGHEPWLSSFAGLLLGAVPGAIRLRKGAVCHLRLDASVTPGAAQLQWLAHPRLVERE